MHMSQSYRLPFDWDTAWKNEELLSDEEQAVVHSRTGFIGELVRHHELIPRSEWATLRATAMIANIFANHPNANFDYETVSGLMQHLEQYKAYMTIEDARFPPKVFKCAVAQLIFCLSVAPYRKL